MDQMKPAIIKTSILGFPRATKINIVIGAAA